MAHGGIDDLGSLVFRSRPGRQVSIPRRRDKAAADPAHGLTSSHGTVLNNRLEFNCILCTRDADSVPPRPGAMTHSPLARKNPWLVVTQWQLLVKPLRVVGECRAGRLSRE